MFDKIIVKYLEQKCIGYSKDFSRTYYESRVLLDDGTECTIYEETRYDESGAETEMSPTLMRPYVARPISTEGESD